MNKSKLIYERAEKFAKDNLEKIRVYPGNYSGSQKCHEIVFHNAYSYQRDNAVVVALSFVPKSGVRVHFLNKNNGWYFDDTLGYLSKYNTYYKIAEFTFNRYSGTEHDVLVSATIDDLEDYEHPLGAEYLLMETKFNILNALFTKEEQEKYEITTNDL